MVTPDTRMRSMRGEENYNFFDRISDYCSSLIPLIPLVSQYKLAWPITMKTAVIAELPVPPKLFVDRWSRTIQYRNPLLERPASLLPHLAPPLFLPAENQTGQNGNRTRASPSCCVTHFNPASANEPASSLLPLPAAPSPLTLLLLPVPVSPPARKNLRR